MLENNKYHILLALILLIAVPVAGCSSSERAANSSASTNNSTADAEYIDLNNKYNALIGLPDRIDAIKKGIDSIDPHKVNQTVLDRYEAEIDSCISTLDDCNATIQRHSTVRKGALGDAPAMAMGNLYEATSHALDNAENNSLRAQLVANKDRLALLKSGVSD
jgi:hypothetical protein